MNGLFDMFMPGASAAQQMMNAAVQKQIADLKTQLDAVVARWPSQGMYMEPESARQLVRALGGPLQSVSGAAMDAMKTLDARKQDRIFQATDYLNRTTGIYLNALVTQAETGKVTSQQAKDAVIKIGTALVALLQAALEVQASETATDRLAYEASKVVKVIHDVVDTVVQTVKGTIKFAGDLGSWTLDIVKWGTIGGGLLLLWWYVLKPKR